MDGAPDIGNVDADDAGALDDDDGDTDVLDDDCDCSDRFAKEADIDVNDTDAVYDGGGGSAIIL